MTGRKDITGRTADTGNAGTGRAATAVAPSGRSEIDAFIAAARAAPAPGTGRLILALDATMSRQPAWDFACSVQAEMFVAAGQASSLSMQLVYFRGHGESRASRFVADGAHLARLMSGVTCAGGLTQIGKVFEHALKENARAKVSALVFIGDAMEEDIDRVADAAGRMGLSRIPAFIFQEGHDAGAERAFKEFARLSGGAWFRFDRSSAGRLADLLKAVAVYAASGRAGLVAHGGAGARLLIENLGGKGR